MTPELDALDEQLVSIISPLAKLREQLITERVNLRAQIVMIDARLVKLNRVLSAVETEPAKPGRKPKKRDTNNWTPNDDVMQGVVAALNMSETPLSVADLAEKTGKSEASIYKAVQVLRTREVIRQAGVQPSPSRQGTNRKIYRLMPNGGGVNGASAS